MRREYELRAGGEIAATLKLHGALNPMAVAETRDGSWTFRREGLLQNRMTIRSTVTGEALGTFRKSNWSSSGELELASGRKYQVTPNGWMSRLQITAADGQPVLRFHSTGVFNSSSHVEVSPTAGTLPELPLLVSAGWYLFLMLHDDAGASAALIAMG
jgi:hypothetical protein